MADSGRSKVFTYTDPTTSTATKYVSSLNFLGTPQVGLNPIVFTLHQRDQCVLLISGFGVAE